MAYVVISRDDSASGYGTAGGVSLTFKISELADLADDATILNAPSGSFYVLNDLSVGSKDPASNQWILPAATPILITTQPSDVSTTAGEITESLTVACYARDSSASYTPTYQWYSNNSEDYTTPSSIEGATSATYAIPAETAAGTYYYFCTITANSKTLNSTIATVVVAAA